VVAGAKAEAEAEAVAVRVAVAVRGEVTKERDKVAVTVAEVAVMKEGWVVPPLALWAARAAVAGVRAAIAKQWTAPPNRALER